MRNYTNVTPPPSHHHHYKPQCACVGASAPTRMYTGNCKCSCVSAHVGGRQYNVKAVTVHVFRPFGAVHPAVKVRSAHRAEYPPASELTTDALVTCSWTGFLKMFLSMSDSSDRTRSVGTASRFGGGSYMNLLCTAADGNKTSETL